MPINRRTVEDSLRLGIYFGDVFQVRSKATVAVGQSSDLCIITKEGLIELSIIDMSTTAELITTQFYEYGDIAITTPVIPVNRNRNDKVPMIEEFGQDVTINDIGTLFDEKTHYGTSGVGSSVVLSQGSSILPWHLEANTSYLLRFINSGSLGMDIDISLFFTR